MDQSELQSKAAHLRHLLEEAVSQANALRKEGVTVTFYAHQDIIKSGELQVRIVKMVCL
jgi:hypothetical protein